MTSILEAFRAGLAPKADAFTELGYFPTPRQAEFHTAAEWDVLFGGAAGPGKTKALLMHGLRACWDYPGIKVAAVRESYPQLAESLLDELAKVGFAAALGATYNRTNHELVFANGSLLRFRYCDGLEDARLRLGTEIQLLLIDEATQQDPAAVAFLCTRLRSSDPKLPVLGVRLASNPGGVGHSWAKARYVVATNHGETAYEDVVDDEATGHLVRFVPARLDDNPHIDPAYERTLAAIPDARLRAALRDGSWDTFAGQVFVEWRHDRHVVDPFKIPPSWKRLSGTDYGYAAPWVTEFAAVDSDHRVWVVGELDGTQVNEHDQARLILRYEQSLQLARGTELRYADPSMWAKTSSANPIAMTYAAEGCTLVKADNDRLSGCQRVHSFLADGPACPIHREMGWVKCPMLHVFRNCAGLIRTLPSLPADPHRPEDVDTDAEDHWYDALRYLLMALPAPRVPRPQAPIPRTIDERAWADRAAHRRPKPKRRFGDMGTL